MKTCPKCGDEKDLYSGRCFGITLTNSEEDEISISIQIVICNKCGFKRCSTKE